MEWTCLLVGFVFLLGITGSLQECLLQSIKGVPSYVCSSIQELEEQGNRGLFDVVIQKNKSVSTAQRKPNLKILLVEDGVSNGINANTFRLLKDIHKLLVRNNELITWPAGLLSYLPIQELHLGHNGISDIEAGAFANLDSLNKLYIIDNKLSVVKSGIFNGLLLNTLDLSNNRISFLEKNAFNNMSRLKHLHLAGNRLSEFQPEILINYPQKLESLHLQNNSFTEIDRNTVRGLNNLKVLNLRDNKISQCSSYTFDDLSKLEVLVLANNLLLDLNAAVFPRNGLPKLEKLYLNNNRLSFLTTTVLERFRNLKYIRIMGNPWQCPCFDAILTWLGDHGVQQKCDRDYYDGARPICVVDDTHPNICDYSNDRFYYNKYSEVNNKAPISPDCEL